MSPAAKYFLFTFLGVIVGGGVASLVLLEQAEHLRDQLRYTENARDSAQEINKSNAAAYSDILNKLTYCNAQRVTHPQIVATVQEIATINNASAGTVIYEPNARQMDVHLSIGLLRGLSLSTLPSFKLGPAGQLGPHWIIPGKVVPTFVGDSQGAIYYFLENNQWSGPFAPQPIPQ